MAFNCGCAVHFQMVIYSWVSYSKMTGVISVVILSLGLSVCIVFTFSPGCGGRRKFFFVMHLFHYALEILAFFHQNWCDHLVMQLFYATVATWYEYSEDMFAWTILKSGFMSNVIVSDCRISVLQVVIMPFL